VKNSIIQNLKELKIQGEIKTDNTSRFIYATDASAYRELPMAITYPKNVQDIENIIKFAKDNKIGLIPRAAGTSLAGQVVGNGIIVDASRYLNKLLEVNIEEKWVTVQPGVILDELNIHLKQFGLFFAPETSTSNRCTIGGMVGNNACGAHSLIYGSTRNHLLELKGFLSDVSFVHFKPLTNEEFENKCLDNSFESKLYQHVRCKLNDKQIQQNIANQFPDKNLERRNTGYAIDLLFDSQPFVKTNKPFNFCKLVAGSEGTLLFVTEIKLNLLPLPPKEKGLLCIHFNSLEDALHGNLIALKYNPGAIELIDNIIINCTKENIEQNKNRFFIQGNPDAIIIVEFERDSMDEILSIVSALENEMRNNKLGYHFPLVTGSDIYKVWSLRKAALGMLSNIKGDAKPVSVIEDTAVTAEKLPYYIADFKKILKKHQLSCVFHAHIATGELHLRPILNLKNENDLIKFRLIATETAHLVKKYKGSISGEHGDGRLRGEFIPIIIGEENFQLIKEIKNTWDPENIFNPGKIVNVPPMDKGLRYIKNEKQISNSIFDFSDSDGFFRHIERCNGSGDCRKTELIGGIMCPSYMATKDESTTTRARANTLREYYSQSESTESLKIKEVKAILNLCLSCKGCKSECPSNVDMTKLKAEFLQQYYSKKGIPIRAWLIGNMPVIFKIGAFNPSLFNFIVSNKILSFIIKEFLGFSQKRRIPIMSKQTVHDWCKENLSSLNEKITNPKQEVCLFIDEFTNYVDAEIGIKSIKLLATLGYKINLVPFIVSGRTYLSKGMVKKAQKIMFTYVNYLNKLVEGNKIMIGIEPSALLTFRDEYQQLTKNSKNLTGYVFLIEEFIANELDKGEITPDDFTSNSAKIQFHGHCYIKVLANTLAVKKMLGAPKNYRVIEIISGCCGMAGAFGYEKDKYKLSMDIGELKLFKAIRGADSEFVISASGTSCRQQIIDGTGKKALHPVEILYNALNIRTIQ
jgi:FAD/FMN-containing dehydrogenase/Fe-S oxidoreductase